MNRQALQMLNAWDAEQDCGPYICRNSYWARSIVENFPLACR
jgi:hypothetical protein